jgi:hypothetical protein
MISLGLGTIVGGNGSSFGGFSAEYQAVLARATTLGYTLPSGGQQAKQNQLILDLKTNGSWDRLDDFHLFRNDGSREFATINWKDPNNLATGTFPTFSSGYGFQGDGSTMFLNLNTSGHTKFTRDSGCFGVYIQDLGNAVSNNRVFIGANNMNNRIRYGTCTINGVAVGTIASAATQKHWMINKNGTACNLYANGTSLASATGTGTAETGSFNVFRYSDLASFGFGQLSVAYKGSEMSALASSYNTIITNYITSL